MNVGCRWLGSVHNAKLLKKKKINKNLQNGKLPITHLQILPGRQKVGNHLIGDPAYPQAPYCLREYSVCFSNAGVLFNNMLRSSRNITECTFGRSKARWGFLPSTVDL